jgi:hypothetical protein
VIAKRRKNRRTGPPPARSPKAEREAHESVTKGPKRKPGEPIPPSPQGVLKRAGFIAAGYVLVLILILKLNTVLAIGVGVLGFGIMVPMGLLIERWRYRSQMRKWTDSRTGAK